ELARHREIAAHQTGKSTTDRQTEPCSALFTGVHCGGLNEWIKDGIESALIDSDTRITDTKRRGRSIAVTSKTDAAAGSSELDRVRQEVEQNLLHPQRIAY